MRFRQKKIIKFVMEPAIAIIFFMAAYMHLLYSPHHQNLSNYRTLAEFGTQAGPNDIISPTCYEKEYNIFPVDFELPEPNFRPVNSIVIPYTNYLVFERVSRTL